MRRIYSAGSDQKSYLQRLDNQRQSTVNIRGLQNATLRTCLYKRADRGFLRLQSRSTCFEEEQITGVCLESNDSLIAQSLYYYNSQAILLAHGRYFQSRMVWNFQRGMCADSWYVLSLMLDSVFKVQRCLG